ncbi:MAG TPA: hypothetical protein PKZ76_11005 [Xanthomonadaceae bacterium]|nr:hypothetical protein [Xanthomonadaceae bacterium]
MTLLTRTILMIGAACAAPVAAFEVDGRLSGSWFNQERSGEGWILQILPQGSAVVFWFTYPPEGEAGEQAWILGQDATIEGNRIVFGQVFTTRGARFGQAFDPDDVEIEPWGDLELEFTDCNHGTVRYQGPPAFGGAERPIQRLTTLEGHACDAPLAKSIQPAHSGAWFDAARSGEGWLVELLDTGAALVYWFTYDDEGRQAWLITIGHRERDTLVFEDVRRPVGTRFGDAFDSDAIELAPWGVLNLVFSGCDTGLLRYDAMEAAFGEGVLQPIRLTALDGSTCAPPPSAAEVAGSWGSGPALPLALSEFAYTTHRERAYIAGGAPGGRDFHEFDPATQAWRRLPDLPQPRDHAMLAGYGDNLYLFGGYVAGLFQPTRQAWRFHLPTSSWHNLPDLPMNMGASGAAALNGRIYVADASGMLVAFDPVAEVYESVPRAPSARDHSQLVSFRGELWLISGRLGSFILRSVDIFDPVAETWRTGPLLNAGRSGFAAAVVADQIMVAGGEVLGDGGAELVPTFEVLASESEGWRFGPLMPTPTHGVAGFGLDGRFHVIAGSTIAGSLAGGVTTHRVYTPQAPPPIR